MSVTGKKQSRLEEVFRLLRYLRLIDKAKEREIFLKYQKTENQSFWQFLLEEKLLSSEDLKKIDQYLRSGYLYCHRCQEVYTLTSAFLMSCPKCKDRREVEVHASLARNTVPEYSIQQVLGRGGYGVVYEVKDPMTGRHMALKVLHTQSESAKRRFLREILITSRLEHPNIIPVYESGYLKDGRPYLIMREIQGGTLKEWMEKHRGERDFLRQGLKILIKVCEALEYAHAKGVVHRDLKPSNIAISDFSEVLVMDWGVALAKGVEDVEEVEAEADRETTKVIVRDMGMSLTQGGMVGTPGYMAPEQARGEKVDRRADIFSLGAILYELLVGHPPFTGSVQERLVRVLLKNPVPPHKVNSSVPRELSAIAMKCLEKDPGRRYSSVRALRQDIELYLEGRSVYAKRDNFLELIWKFVKRNRVAVAVALVSFLVFGSVWFGIEYQRRRQKEQKVEKLLSQVEKLWESGEMISPAELVRQYEEYENFEEEPEEAKVKRRRAMEVCLKIVRKLEELWAISPGAKVKRKLFEAKKRLGELALIGGEEVLCQLSFSECERLFPKEGKVLLKKYQFWRERKFRQWEGRLREILQKLKEAPPLGALEEMVVRVVRMKSRWLVQRLLELLRSEKASLWQKRLAVQALGIIGERRIVYLGKDVVEWLLFELEKEEKKPLLKWETNYVVDLIWALGRLRDPRANELVRRVRKKWGQDSFIWKETIFPYSLIPRKEEEKQSQDFESLVRLGMDLLDKREPKRAVEIGKKLVALDSSRFEGYRILGDGYYFSGAYRKAIAAFTKAIKRAKKKEEKVYVYLQRGQCQWRLRNFQAALQDVSRAIQIEPRNLSAYNIRGAVLRALGRPDLAVRDYSFVLRFREDSLVYNNRGNAYLDMGKVSEAIADFSRAIQLDPKLFLAYANRGRAYKLAGELRRALDDFSQALRLHPGDYRARMWRAKTYAELGMFKKALEDLHRLPRSTYKTFPSLYLFRARIYLKLGSAHLAESDLKKLLKSLSPSHPLYQKAKEMLKKIGKREEL